MTLILWRNKELHQGQCHTVSEGRSSHTQLSGPLVHAEQLLKDCAAIPLKLAPIMSLSPPSHIKRKSPSKMDNFSGITQPGDKCHMFSVFIVRIKAEGSRHGFLQVPEAFEPWEV